MKKSLFLLFIGMISMISVNAQLTESFDGVTFPPSGWLNLHTTGADPAALWESAVAGALGGDSATTTFHVDPHSGAGMATFRSYDFAAGNGAQLITTAVDLSTGGPYLISFWMYRDNKYTNPDSLSVYVNTSQSTTGALFLGKILRKTSLAPTESGADGWYQYSFNTPPGFNTASNYFIFSAVGSFGNNIFIDDISVEPQPSCSPPADIMVTGVNYGAGTATATWTAPVSATISGYEWAVNTTGTAPTSAGTAVSGTTANITGITANVLNFIYVRTNCGSGGFSAWAHFTFAALSCATVIAPANGATNIPSDQSFFWTDVTGATSYNFYLGNAPDSGINRGNLSGTGAQGSGDLLPEHTYYWYVVPLINNVQALSSTCTVNSFTIAAEAINPVNNICNGAISINSNNGNGNPVIGTTLNANLTLPANNCEGSSGLADDDVWFKFTTTAVTPAGTLTITPLESGGITNIVAEVYAATSCDNLGPLITCANATTATDPEEIDLNMLSPGAHYLMRVYSYTGAPMDRGGFAIIASGGSTLPVNFITFSVRNFNGVSILNWETQQELNTKSFEVEHSIDGRNFLKIGQVTSTKGNSNTAHNYTFTDSHPEIGINYYRLRIVDIDNSERYSEVESVKITGSAGLTFYPNPAKNNMFVRIIAERGGLAELSIIDISGRKSYSRQFSVVHGTNNFSVDVTTLSQGMYYIKIQLSDKSYIEKFNKL